MLTNQINGKQYVGKSQETAQKRFRQHVRDAKAGSTCHIHRAISKYGKDSFLVETVDSAVTKEELKQKEVEWVTKLDTFKNGYNMTPGGDGHGHKHSEDTKQKLRERQIAYFQNPDARKQAAEFGRLAKITDEEKERRRVIMIGNQRSKGMTYHHTVEAREAISRAHKGKVLSEETRLKISQRKNKAYGNRNAMADPMNRAKVAASKIGRKKMYREDGTAYMGYPSNLNTHSESPS